MRRTRFDERDAAAANASGFASVGNEAAALVPLGANPVAPLSPDWRGAVPTRPDATTDAGGSVAGTGDAPSDAALRVTRWRPLRIAARIVRNAAIAVAAMALVPIGLVVVRGSDMQRRLYTATWNTDARVHAVDEMRAFRVAPDPSIAPIQAGLALNAVQPAPRPAFGYPGVDPGPRPAATWRATPPASDLFPSARPDMYDGPSSRSILEVAAHGVNARELAYLETLATAPIWSDFDLVARAPSVDIIGGQFRTPFSADARAEQRPLMQYREIKELAFAAVSRAAYHEAIGQRDSAEAVLRSVVSFGFTLIDNGSSTMDALIGTVVVGIGRDALQRLYVIEHDPRANAPALNPPHGSTSIAGSAPSGQLSGAEIRRRLLGRVEDPTVPLGERFDALQKVPELACTNTRELLFGPNADARGMLARVPRTLARFPSERALIDLETRPLIVPTSGPLGAVPLSLASIAGAALHNPRMAECTLVLMGSW